MSAIVMGRVWNLDLPHNQLLVLLAMADHADHHGNNVYPGVPLIAWKTGYTEMQVRRVIKILTASGILVEVNRSKGKKVKYRIDLDKGQQKPDYTPHKKLPLTPNKMLPPAKSNPLLFAPPDPSHFDTSTPNIPPEENPGINRHIEPSIETEEEKDSLSASAEEMFARQSSQLVANTDAVIENLDTPQKPVEVDKEQSDERTLLQYAVRGYFDLPKPTAANKGYSRQQMFINFFTGQMKPDPKKKKGQGAWFENQFDDEPFTAAEIIGLASWWENKYENIDHPVKPDKIREWSVLFRASKNHNSRVADGRKWLLQQIEKDKPKPEPSPDDAMPPDSPEEFARKSHLMDDFLNSVVALAERQANG